MKKSVRIFSAVWSSNEYLEVPKYALIELSHKDVSRIRGAIKAICGLPDVDVDEVRLYHGNIRYLAHVLPEHLEGVDVFNINESLDDLKQLAASNQQDEDMFDEVCDSEITVKGQSLCLQFCGNECMSIYTWGYEKYGGDSVETIGVYLEKIPGLSDLSKRPVALSAAA